MALQDPCSLYRLWSGDGRLLYVGIGGNPGRRFEQHRTDKPWWGEVARITLEHFDSRTEAMTAESAAIRAESPLYNIMHNRKRVVPPRSGVALVADRTDRLTTAVDEPLKPDSLVGSFFHSFEKDDPRKVCWQGCVVAEPAPGFYLVETFTWLAGDSYTQQLVRIEDMAGWQFYDSAEWMNNMYNTTLSHRRHADD